MRKYIFILAVMVFAVAAACTRRDLYIESETPLEVIVNMNWTELGSVPDGASIYFYPEGGGDPYTFRTNSVTRAKVSVPAGYYTVIAFNRTVDEFGTFSFHDMDKLGYAGITFFDKKVSWIDSRQDTVGRVVYEPESIVVGRTDHFLVRNKIDRLIAEKKTATNTSIAAAKPEVDSVDVYERKMLYTTYVTLKVKGVQNIKSVRAYLNGMADGALIATRGPSDDNGAYTMESWTVSRSIGDYTVGAVSSNFVCMGLPTSYLDSRRPENNKFVVQFLLVDNSTIITKSFDVGDIIVQNDDMLTLSLDIDLTDDPLPDVKPEGGSESGFNVTIGDWGDSEDFVVPM